VHRLCFLLSRPKHRLYKNPHGLSREDLVFQNARIGKGIGQIIIAREYHNGERGDKFATRWITTDVSAEDFYGNFVTIHNLNDALLSKMHKWNEQNPDRKDTDCITIDYSPILNTHVYLPSEHFCRLLQTNWKERFLNLTLTTKQSLEGIQLGFSVEGKNAFREGKEDWCRLENDAIKIEIENYEIAIEDLPSDTMKSAADSVQFNILRRLFRFFFGRLRVA
jgi:hypothetical protein